MRIVLDAVINNPNLPLIDPALALVRPSVIEIFDGLSLNGVNGIRNMQLQQGTAPVFDGVSMAMAADTIINTNINERDSMSIICCWNLDRNTGQPQIAIGNMAPGSGARTGFRLATAGSNTASLAVASGVASPATYGISPSTHTGGWTCFTIVLTPGAVTRINRSGTVTTQNAATRAKSAEPVYLNGLPASLNADISAGFTGKLGFMCAYDEALSTADAVALMNKIQGIMAARGVSVP